MGIATLWLTVLVALLRTNFDVFGRLPISYLGIFQTSKQLFDGGLIIASVLLLIFLTFLTRKLRPSKWFIYIFMIGQLCQIVVALTPYNAHSVIKSIHVISAFGLAFTLPFSMRAFKHSVAVPVHLRTLTGRFLRVELLLFVLGLGWFILASKAGALSEIVTAIGFDVWIVWLSVRLRPATSFTPEYSK